MLKSKHDPPFFQNLGFLKLVSQYQQTLIPLLSSSSSYFPFPFRSSFQIHAATCKKKKIQKALSRVLSVLGYRSSLTWCLDERGLAHYKDLKGSDLTETEQFIVTANYTLM